MHNPTDLRALEARHAEEARLERLRLDEERDDLRRLMSGEHGRRFIYRLIERAGVFRLSVDQGAPEATHLTAFNEGRRNEGLRILDLVMDACPEHWASAQREARDADDARRKAHA